jgi:pimeloyl-ACP methyl ester carboxylesterase
VLRVPSSGGVELALHDLGGSSGAPPLLIAHATGFCGRAYEPLAAALSSSGRFHVWAVDFRGHGDSTRPLDGDFRWSGMGDDVLAVADALADALGVGLGSLHGFGHSMGGAALLSASLARPGVLASLCVYEPIVLPPAWGWEATGGENPLAGPARRRRPEFPSRAEALYRYAGRPPLNVLRSDSLAAYVEHGFADVASGVRLKCSPADEAATFEAEPKLTVDDVRGLDVAPSVVVGVGGLEDPAGPSAFGPLVADALVGARLVTYPHLGHFGPLQAPEVVAADVQG